MSNDMSAAIPIVGRVAVVIPAHNEAGDLSRCLKAVRTAAVGLSVSVLTVVVLDACDDESASLAQRFADVRTIAVELRNVGAARAAGFDHARAVFGDDDESTVWYATTDADSCVDADWLTRQIDAEADMVLGVVRVTDWRHFSTAAVNRYLAAYRAKSRRLAGDKGHGHVHGANMGFRADMYWRVGGFAPLSTGEDVDLVRRFEAAGHRIHRDAALSVVTSARHQGRAPRGFAGYLRSVARHGGAT